MPIQKNLTDEQILAMEEYFTGRTATTDNELNEFIDRNNLPWSNAAAFRVWAKENGYYKPDGSRSGGSSSSGPTLRGIRKFEQETEAVLIADLLLQDPTKAITGAISALEDEIKSIELESEQQKAKIDATAKEQIDTRTAKIQMLQAKLSER